MKESPYLDENGFLLGKLQSIPFLGEMSETHIKKILRLSKLRKYEDEEAITLEDSVDPWIYILFSGEAKVTKNGREIARLVEVGSAFGEVAVLDGKLRSATVQAIGTTICLAINAAIIKEAADPFEQAIFVSLLYKIFAEVLAGRLRRKDDELSAAMDELEQARSKLNKVKHDLPRLQKTDAELSKVRAELEELKNSVAKRWLLVKDEPE